MFFLYKFVTSARLSAFPYIVCLTQNSSLSFYIKYHHLKEKAKKTDNMSGFKNSNILLIYKEKRRKQ